MTPSELEIVKKLVEQLTYEVIYHYPPNILDRCESQLEALQGGIKTLEKHGVKVPDQSLWLQDQINLLKCESDNRIN